MQGNTENRTSKARAARRTALGEVEGGGERISPRQRGEQKAREALDWVYRWGWSSPSVVDGLAGTARRGLAARLARAKLLRSTRTDSGGAQKGVPASILTLTGDGLAEVEKFREDLLPYELDPYRIRQDQLRHYQLAQSATAKALSEKKISGFQTEKEMAEFSGSNIKQPDIAWWLPNGQSVAVEVELSAKWGRDLDHFILSCLLSLSPEEKGGKHRYDYIALVTDSPAILKRYKAAFEPGAAYGVWQKDERSRWEKSETRKVPEGAKGKMLWRLITD